MCICDKEQNKKTSDKYLRHEQSLRTTKIIDLDPSLWAIPKLLGYTILMPG